MLCRYSASSWVELTSVSGLEVVPVDCHRLDRHIQEVVDLVVDLVVQILVVQEGLDQEVLVDLQESQTVDSHLARCHLEDLVVGLGDRWDRLVVFQREIG